MTTSYAKAETILNEAARQAVQTPLYNQVEVDAAIKAGMVQQPNGSYKPATKAAQVHHTNSVTLATATAIVTFTLDTRTNLVTVKRSSSVGPWDFPCRAVMTRQRANREYHALVAAGWKRW